MSSLIIKDEEACRLIRELATLRGESMTAVVIHAAREALERERKPQINEARMRYWLDFGQRVREMTDPASLAQDPFGDMYDEYGLPK